MNRPFARVRLPVILQGIQGARRVVSTAESEGTSQPSGLRTPKRDRAEDRS